MALAFAKPLPRALEKKQRTRAMIDIDILESQKVRARANGQCEVRELLRDGTVVRCTRKAYHLHHVLSGWGRRARGSSALAENKLHTCARCHQEIHAHILKRHGNGPSFSDVYERVR